MLSDTQKQSIMESCADLPIIHVLKVLEEVQDVLLTEWEENEHNVPSI